MPNLLALKSAFAPHNGKVYFLNPHHVVCFYEADDMNSTIVYMVDGKTYNVKETPDEIAGAFGEVWTW